MRYLGNDFTFRLEIDNTYVNGTQGDITLKLTTPLAVQSGINLADQENQSLRAEEQNTLFFLCGRINGFDKDLTRFLAMKEVIDNWKGDAHRSEEARKLAQDREANDLPKLERKVLDGLKEGIRTGHVIFRGFSRSQVVKYGETPGDTLENRVIDVSGRSSIPNSKRCRYALPMISAPSPMCSPARQKPNERCPHPEAIRQSRQGRSTRSAARCHPHVSGYDKTPDAGYSVRECWIPSWRTVWVGPECRARGYSRTGACRHGEGAHQ